MLRVTDPQLENLMFLRDVVIPWMRENPKRVRFDVFETYCGTYGCLFGWYSMMRYGQPTDKRFGSTPLSRGVPEEFGITNQGACLAIFGCANAGALSDRAARLEQIIEERVAAMEVA